MKKHLFIFLFLVLFLNIVFAQSTAKIAMDLELNYDEGYDENNFITEINSDTYFYLSLYIKDVENLNAFDVRMTFDTTRVEDDQISVINIINSVCVELLQSAYNDV